MLVRGLVSAFLAVLVAASAIAAPTADTAKRRARAGKAQLKAFSSCAPLVRYARGHAKQGRGAIAPRLSPQPPVRFVPPPMGAPGPGGDGPAPPQPIAFRRTEGSETTSPTNVQEAGVDEPDLVKTRGSKIFAAAAGRVHAVEAGQAPRLLGSITVPGFGHELLLSGSRLLVLSHAYAVQATQRGPSRRPYGGRPVAILTEVDVREPGAMRILRTQRIGGTLVSSRLNGDTARVVVSSPARGLAEADLRPRLAGWVPRATLLRRGTGRSTTRRLTDCRRVRRSRAYAGVDMLTVLTIDMSKGLPAVDTDALMAGAEIAYASPSSLYVAAQRWEPEPNSPNDRPPDTRTDVHKFDISNPGRTEYRGSGTVPGYLLNQFSLSEHRGVLRAATTETPLWWEGTPARESQSFVSTLDDRAGRLAEVGRVDGLGRGERIYAVRFVEDAGFVVTFRQTDPLYTVDLSDPRHPRVLGELKIRGYSAYLHPLAGDLLLGVGQDATDQGDRLGTQLSLFDVSDLRRPSRLQQRSVGSGSSSQVEYDHHAFLWWAPSKLAVLPVEDYGEGQQFVGAIGFGVARSGVSERGRAAHEVNGYAAPILRSFVVGGRLFTLSDVGLEANALSSLAEEGSLRFPAPPPDGT